MYLEVAADVEVSPDALLIVIPPTDWPGAAHLLLWDQPGFFESSLNDGARKDSNLNRSLTVLPRELLLIPHLDDLHPQTVDCSWIIAWTGRSVSHTATIFPALLPLDHVGESGIDGDSEAAPLEGDHSGQGGRP